MEFARRDILAAHGMVELPLENDEEPSVVIARIEALVSAYHENVVSGNPDGAIAMIRRSQSNVVDDVATGAIQLGEQVVLRRVTQRNARKNEQLFDVLSVVHRLLREGKRIAQRELYYLLIDSFDNQQQLNDIVLDASATLGVPRFALNVGAATRGVVAGCLRLAKSGSVYQVDCEHVGTNGWPIPGDVRVACSLVVHSTARYILIIEKFGIFSRLVQDRFYELLPCILLCGKGYPSVATRALASLLEQRLKIPVLGVADFNPHGLGVLQCYRRGSVRSAVEGSRFVCTVRWLGLRASHIERNASIGMWGEALTARDESLLRNLELRDPVIRADRRYMRETRAMRELGKYELQWLYGHARGVGYFSQVYLLDAILRADYL